MNSEKDLRKFLERERRRVIRVVMNRVEEYIDSEQEAHGDIKRAVMDATELLVARVVSFVDSNVHD